MATASSARTDAFMGDEQDADSHACNLADRGRMPKRGWAAVAGAATPYVGNRQRDDGRIYSCTTRCVGNSSGLLVITPGTRSQTTSALNGCPGKTDDNACARDPGLQPGSRCVPDWLRG